jgi:signal transduction histidine kinase
MGRMLRDASIRTKVLTLVIIVAGVALVLASAALLTTDYYQYRTDIRQNLATQARMVLENSTAAMSFQDPEAAQETLATLSPNEHIRIGCLYNAGGRLFARFTPDRSSEAQCPANPPVEEYRYQSNRVHVVARTSVAGRPAGSVYLESDLQAVSDRARVQVLTATGILGLAMVVALLLTSALRRVISEPIDALGETARLVTTRQDYSLRARKTTGDELGLLVDAFNAMLSQIERAEQERTLLLAREREANRLKDDFLMTLSHELRTPLNAIQGWTRMLITHVIPAEGVDRALEKIERNAQAQSRLVEDLLEVSRFTTGKFRLGRLPIDLVTIINQAIETSRPDAESRGITIERQFDLPSAPLTGDPDRLQQVVWNLLSNAVKFSAPHSQVVVGLRAAGSDYELRVVDHGIGIGPAFLPYVFEPFRQADATTTRAHGGLGLGLAIVRRIVDLHGGRIEAASGGVGQGATFTVRLPVAGGAAATVASSRGLDRQPDPHDLAGVRIVVVDDDRDTREILSTILTAAGAQAYEASTVAEALRLSRDVMPEVVVSDIAMPDQDGYTLLRALRTEFGRSVPRIAIALTAQATDADRERALAGGFDRHVAKPFDPLRLVELLRDVLAGGY